MKDQSYQDTVNLLDSIRAEVEPQLKAIRDAQDRIDGRQLEEDKQGWTAPGHLEKYRGNGGYKLHSPSPDVTLQPDEDSFESCVVTGMDKAEQEQRCLAGNIE